MAVSHRQSTKHKLALVSAAFLWCISFWRYREERDKTATVYAGEINHCHYQPDQSVSEAWLFRQEVNSPCFCLLSV